ncbi:MAG TPA: deoxyribose-phosphate aldolase, partial [Verrucomicrobiota bacterium]|nr:deoxyribose-phosphate aldolase [Verrucomicrobiota bacterium]
MPDTPETPLGPYIDHTNLRPDAISGDIEKLCAEAIEHQLFAVCVNGCWVQHAYNHLADTDISIATVIGFPLGASDSDSKRYETEAAVDNGAHEIDMVMNLGRFIDGDHRYIVREIR